MQIQSKKLTTPILLSLIVILGLALRLWRLDYQSLWLDEYFAIYLADNWEISNLVTIPPLYLVLLHWWFRIFPFTEVTARLLGALIGSFSIIPFYYLGKALFDKKTAIASSFFIAISALHVDYCQEAKYYPLALLSVMLMQFMFLKILKDQRPRNLFWYCILSASALYIHYFTLFIFVIQAVYLVIHRKTKEFNFTKIIFVQALSITLLIPWILPIIKDPRLLLVGPLAWIPDPTRFSIVYTTMAMVAGKSWQYSIPPNITPDWLHLLYWSFFFIFLTLLFRSLAAIKDSKPVQFVLLWTAMPTIFFFIFSKLLFSIYHIRYFLYSVLALYLLFGWLYAQEKNIYLKMLFGLLFVIININSLVFYYTHPVRPQHRQAASYLAEHVHQRDKIIMRGYAYQGRTLRYYFSKTGKKNVVDYRDDSGPTDINAYQWFVFSSFGKDWKVPDELCRHKQLHGLTIYRRCEAE